MMVGEITSLMSNPDMDRFVGKCNEALRDAVRAGISEKELATNLIIMASVQFDKSTELQEEYDTFAHFAQDKKFEVDENYQNNKDFLRRLTDEFDE